MDLFSIALPQQTATMATIELCPGSFLGEGFQLQIGLAEIHVPRMWVEEDNKGHHVSQHEKRALFQSFTMYCVFQVACSSQNQDAKLKMIT